MEAVKQISIYIIIVGFILVVTCYNFGQQLIHKINYSRTPEDQFDLNKKQYYDMTLAVNGLSRESALKEFGMVDSLYLWFAVRGVNIDDGHSAKTVSDRWAELKEYNDYGESDKDAYVPLIHISLYKTSSL